MYCTASAVPDNPMRRYTSSPSFADDARKTRNAKPLAFPLTSTSIVPS